DAVALVDGWLHREQAEYAVGAAADLRRAALAPGPDRGADVVHGADAGLPELAFQAQVEVGRVHADEDIRLPLQQPATQAGAQAQQARQVLEHFRHAHYRQFRAVVPGVEAFGAQHRPADAGELRVRETVPQLAYQAGGQQIARGLASHQGE